jgi:hypothetical protein
VKTENAVYTISVPPRSVGERIHVAIHDLLTGGDRDLVVLRADTMEMDFVTPAELCGLRIAVLTAARVARLVEFYCPVNSSVHGYLSRVNFYSNLPDNVQLNRPAADQKRWDRSRTLIELTAIQDGKSVCDLMAHAAELVERHFGNQQLGESVGIAVGVLCENVLEHAETPIQGLLAAQRYREGVELSIVDIGRGIPASLRDNPLYADLSDPEAVRAALSAGVSGIAEEGRGGGLPQLLDGCRQLRGARLRILTGTAHIAVEQRKGVEEVVPTSLHVPVTGTWVYVRFRAGDSAKEVA